METPFSAHPEQFPQPAQHPPVAERLQDFSDINSFHLL